MHNISLICMVKSGECIFNSLMKITSLPILFSKLNGTTDRAVWDPPDMSKCIRTVDFDDLENITVTVGKLSIWGFFGGGLFVR